MLFVLFLKSDWSDRKITLLSVIKGEIDIWSRQRTRSRLASVHSRHSNERENADYVFVDYPSEGRKERMIDFNGWKTSLRIVISMAKLYVEHACSLWSTCGYKRRHVKVDLFVHLQYRTLNNVIILNCFTNARKVLKNICQQKTSQTACSLWNRVVSWVVGWWLVWWEIKYTYTKKWFRTNRGKGRRKETEVPWGKKTLQRVSLDEIWTRTTHCGSNKELF